MVSRRQIFGAIPALGAIASCARAAPVAQQPGRGWVVSQSGKILGSDFTGRAKLDKPRAFNSEAPFRMASITKLVVAMAIRDWAATGRLDLDAPVADVLPDTPEGLNLAHLLSHRSGLRDPDVYWADVNTDIRTLFSREDFTHPPGTYFRYANLGYGLAATIVEARLGERFDLLVWRWLTRNGFDAGLNWSGMSPRRRKRAAAAYRQTDGEWAATVDAHVPIVRPVYLGAEDTDLTTYVPGTNGTLFSPQGGMRMSLSDLIRVGELLHKRPDFHAALWTHDDNNGDDEDAHFLAFGPGSYVYSAETSPLPGVPLIGHLGWAYGVHSGAFIVPGTNISFAFTRLGSGADEAEMTGQSASRRANQFTVHQALFDALAPTVLAAL